MSSDFQTTRVDTLCVRQIPTEDLFEFPEVPDVISNKLFPEDTASVTIGSIVTPRSVDSSDASSCDSFIDDSYEPDDASSDSDSSPIMVDLRELLDIQQVLSTE